MRDVRHLRQIALVTQAQDVNLQRRRCPPRGRLPTYYSAFFILIVMIPAII